MSEVVDRFLEYVKIDTGSDEGSSSVPSTDKQFVLARKLVEELRGLGLEDAEVDERCYVMATLPSNTGRDIPVVGLIAHLDTSPDVTGAGVAPRIVEDYDGGDIRLDEAGKTVLSPGDFPELGCYVGQTLITTDGSTLLGADDKAGIAEIMTVLKRLADDPGIEHGTIKVAFTPDEEIGRGADHFDVKKFGADLAYTLDGGMLGELEFENFNAAKATLTFRGRNVHPGYAKDKMINSMIIAMEFNSLLPPAETPFHTQDYEGFYHMTAMSGDVETSRLTYIVRDHDMEKFKARKSFMEQAAKLLNTRYGEETVVLEMEDQYYNMREKIEPVMHVVDIAEKAMLESGVEPRKKPIRGGTDGARLSYMGLPTPNLFTGGHNFHGRFEFIPVQSMEKAVDVVLRMISLYAEG